MSDLINRQDAIDAIKTMPIVEALGAISNLPSAEQWIPCSERLPKDKQRIIIQYYNGNMEIITFSAIGLTDHLLAWMPLPEPYMRGEEE